MDLKPGDSTEKWKNVRVGRALGRLFTFLWAIASLLLILAAVYLALKGT